MSIWYGKKLSDRVEMSCSETQWWWVPRSKRRSDSEVEELILRIVLARCIKNYVEADELRKRLISDGAIVTYEHDGTVRVCY